MHAYYARSATREFWAKHWGVQSPAALGRSAEHSPLATLILKNMPSNGARVLEAGCGVGQYVVPLVLRRLAPGQLSSARDTTRIHDEVTAKLKALRSGAYPPWCVIFLAKPVCALALPLTLRRVIGHVGTGVGYGSCAS